MIPELSFKEWLTQNEAGDFEYLHPPSYFQRGTHQKATAFMRQQTGRITCPIVDKAQQFYQWIKDLSRTSAGLAIALRKCFEQMPQLHDILLSLPLIMRLLSKDRESLAHASSQSILEALQKVSQNPNFDRQKIAAELTLLEKFANDPATSDVAFAEKFLRTNTYALLMIVAKIFHLPEIKAALPGKAEKFLIAYNHFKSKNMQAGAKALFVAFAAILFYILQITVFTGFFAKVLAIAGFIGLAKWFLGGSYFIWGMIFLLRKIQSFTSPGGRAAAILGYLILLVDPGAGAHNAETQIEPQEAFGF